MVRGQAPPEAISESIATSGANGSASNEGTELTDELGPIGSFPPSVLDPETGRVLPV